MPRPFVLPDLGEGLTEAEVVKVLVREGEVVQEDAPLLEVETDKATVEIPSPMSGRVETIHVAPNQTVHVGQVLVSFADVGAAAPGNQAAATLDPASFKVQRTRRPGVYRSGGKYVVPFWDELGGERRSEFETVEEARAFRAALRLAEKRQQEYTGPGGYDSYPGGGTHGN